jgi:beta-N-acetylhexosaminidase
LPRRTSQHLAARTIAVLFAALLAVPALAQPAPASAATFAQLVGQKLMVAMAGTTPSADLLGRVQRGEVGGVILFGSNITSAAQLAALTSKLRQAAVAGGQPHLLIATDQEGGSVKRVPWAPPTLSVPQMGSLGSASTATSQGRSTGVVLGCAGINSDLAPVADVPGSTSSFMYQQGRTWSFSASTTATLSDAFASGLEAGGDVPAMKHFPGIGFATLNTDSHVVTITASKASLAAGLTPYQAAIGHHIPMIMLANATYTAYDSANAAGWSPAISSGLLRTTLGFTGVSITDSLSGTAAARGVSPTTLAIKAAQAGTDMIMLTGSEAATKSSYVSLLAAAQNGTIPLARLQASYTRILALKSTLTSPPADTTAPTTRARASRPYARSTRGSTTTPLRTSWSASAPCGISAYTLERRINGGTWAVQGLSSGIATSIAQSLAFGSTYRYVAKAGDGAGNTSGWRYGPTFEPLLSQQSSSSIAYGGTWHTVANGYASGGSLAYSTVAGARATFRFTGQAVSWVAYRGPTRGSAKVYVDGVYRATVNLYSSTYLARQVMYATSWTANGSHSITIVNLGTAGHSRVDVDAFVRLLDL